MANKTTKYRNKLVKQFAKTNKITEKEVINTFSSVDPVFHGHPPVETGNNSFRIFGI